MSEIVLDLLNPGRSKTNINPEVSLLSRLNTWTCMALASVQSCFTCSSLPPLFQRMIIGLRAFLLIADSLEKDEGDPPLPMNVGPLPSGGTPRVKTKFLSTTLTDETAKKIGIAPFYPTSVRIPYLHSFTSHPSIQRQFIFHIYTRLHFTLLSNVSSYSIFTLVYIAPFYPTSVHIPYLHSFTSHPSIQRQFVFHSIFTLVYVQPSSSSTVFSVPCSASSMHWTRVLVALSYAPYHRLLGDLRWKC